MNQRQYIELITIRGMTNVLQKKLDIFAQGRANVTENGNPVYKHKLKSTCKAFREQLDKEIELQYAILPPDVIEQYNLYATAIEGGIEEIQNISLID
jgi:hypothetical protein